MMRRRIFLWMGLGILLASWGLCRESQARETYQVRPGDTLYGISEKLGVTPNALKAANRLTNSNLKPDQILTIPTSNASKSKVASFSTGSRSKAPSSAPHKDTIYRVKKGDTLARVAKRTGVSVADLREINQIKGSALKIGQIMALSRKQNRHVAPELVGYVQNRPKPEMELEEEEEDGGLTSERAWTEIEQRVKESAELFGYWNTPEEQRLLVKVAMGFLGAPYRLGGSSVTGLDCSGFVKKIYQLFNIDLPRTSFAQSLVGLRVSRNELVEGDLLFFNTRRSLGHVGIYIGNNEFVHASSRKRGVRIDNLNMPYFNKRFVRAVRLKKSDEGL